jgi:hypothetical protein
MNSRARLTAIVAASTKKQIRITATLWPTCPVDLCFIIFPLFCEPRNPIPGSKMEIPAEVYSLKEFDDEEPALQ